MYVCMYVCTYVCMYEYVCMYVCMYVDYIALKCNLLEHVKILIFWARKFNVLKIST
jgi:hypothetical protein